MKWPEVTIETADGPRKAIAPQVISASRSTDIPAFHASWLRDRLNAGYCKWINPFNRRPYYVSFERARAFVLWTKNAAPCLNLLPELDRRGLAYYFQFTVNDYEAEGLEPHVPPLLERLATFKSLSQLIGRERVVWRFDPLLLTRELTVDALLAKVEKVGEELHPYTEKLVFSFADISRYAKVQRNLTQAGVDFCEFDAASMHAFAAGLARMLGRWGLDGRTCAEAIDLSGHGVQRNRCVDADLLLRISHNDCELRRAFAGDAGVTADLFGSYDFDQDLLKDKGQREVCGCIWSKDIGQYNTCPHLCLYCYANTSARIVQNNIQHVSPNGESILPDLSRVVDECKP